MPPAAQWCNAGQLCQLSNAWRVESDRGTLVVPELADFRIATLVDSIKAGRAARRPSHLNRCDDDPRQSRLLPSKPALFND